MTRIDDFDYELPPHRIAQTPLADRSSSKLLVDRGSGQAEHRRVSDLATLLEPGDLVVINDTKVLPARIFTARPTGGRTEILLLEPDGPAAEALKSETSHWVGLVKPSKKVAPGTELTIDGEADLAIMVGEAVQPEIMIPLVSSDKELAILKNAIARVAEDCGNPKYTIGTMIELPRAALRAGDIAAHAAFFSFGTNDLTQTTFGLSRDDAGKFLPDYVAQGIMEKDPFVTLDKDGVGDLIKIAAERGKAVNSALKMGICGEHGGDPASIDFCHQAGLNYVSCSPYRVPIARLAAAQAAIFAKNAES